MLRSREQKIDQRESSEADTLRRLLTQATLAVFSGPILDRMMWRTKSPASSRPMALVSLSLLLLCVGSSNVSNQEKLEKPRFVPTHHPLVDTFHIFLVS